MNYKAVFAITGLLALIGCGSLGYGQYTCSQLDAEIQGNRKELAEIQKQSTEAEDVVTEAEVEMARNNISDMGNRIAGKQNELAGLKDGDARQAIFDEMKGYFTDTLLQIEWYPTDVVDAQWVFESTFDCAGNEIPVIWTLTRPGDGTLLSYVCGTYVVDADEFKNMTLRKTLAGEEAMVPQVEGDAPAPDNGDGSGDGNDGTNVIGNDMRVPAQDPDDPSRKLGDPAPEAREGQPADTETPQGEGEAAGTVVEDDGTTVTGFVTLGGEA